MSSALISASLPFVVRGIDIAADPGAIDITQQDVLAHWIALARQGLIAGIVCCPPRATWPALPALRASAHSLRTKMHIWGAPSNDQVQWKTLEKANSACMAAVSLAAEVVAAGGFLLLELPTRVGPQDLHRQILWPRVALQHLSRFSSVRVLSLNRAHPEVAKSYVSELCVARLPRFAAAVHSSVCAFAVPERDSGTVSPEDRVYGRRYPSPVGNGRCVLSGLLVSAIAHEAEARFYSQA